MRFRKGDKVEVMNSKKAPFSWRAAEILYGNGHTFRVRYDLIPGLNREPLVESVSKKLMRPFPPHVGGIENLVAGDVVEVFDRHSWKIAVVLKFLGGKRDKRKNFRKLYLVSLIGGHSEALTVDRSNIRMPQTWQDDNWILLEKNSVEWEDTIASKTSTSNGYQKLHIRTGAAFCEHEAHSSGSLKRMSPYRSSIAEVYDENALKLRAIEGDGAKRRMPDPPMLEKVDAVAYPREYLGVKSMHTPYNNIAYGYNNTNDVMGCSGVRISGLHTSASDSCSVGSCSMTNQSKNNICDHFIPRPFQVTDDIYCSDAESCCGLGYDRKSCSIPSKEEVEISIHMLELQAYRCTLEALYASGPLSWDQEALLTNLRIMLHVTNDEHLMELKHLISA